MVRGRKSQQRKSNNGPRVRSNDEAIRWAESHSRELKSAYEAGNKNALWKMIVVCALSRAASILEGADNSVAWGELNSWNELFGKPRLKSRNVILGWNRRLEVWERIMDLHLRGAPINDDLFDRVGKELGIGARETVRKLYKAVNEEFGLARRKT
jgi:hypothetical protein